MVGDEQPGTLKANIDVKVLSYSSRIPVNG